VARYRLTVRRMAWPNVLLVGGGVGVVVVSFLLLFSLIRSYVEPPKIPTARPLLASAEAAPVELTGLGTPILSPIEYARATENLAAVMAQRETTPPPTVEEPAGMSSVVPLPPRRPRVQMLTVLSSNVPVPRPRPRE
jgi:hypothetical protein